MEKKEEKRVGCRTIKLIESKVLKVYFAQAGLLSAGDVIRQI